MAEYAWADIETWVANNAWTFTRNEDADGIYSYSVYDDAGTEIVEIPHRGHPTNDSGVSGFNRGLVTDVMIYEAEQRWQNGDSVGAIRALAFAAGDLIEETGG